MQRCMPRRRSTAWRWLIHRWVPVACLAVCLGLARCDAPDPQSAPPRGVKTGSHSETGAVPTPADYAKLRNRMVDALQANIKSRRVLDAMRRVPRHEFVPPEIRARSYVDNALPINEGQTISQPTVVAIMTELLDLDGTETVLEIGTGSGYQAAILGELAKSVYTVEILPALASEARGTIERLQGESVLTPDKIHFVVGDGRMGHEDAAPYDAIIVTAAPQKVPEALIRQLKPGGRLVIPVGDYYQELRLITKDKDGKVNEEGGTVVRFVRLVGDESGESERK